MDALLMCVRLTNTIGYRGQGDFARNKDGTLQRKGDLVYSGVQIIKTDLLDQIKERAFSLNKIWDIMFGNTVIDKMKKVDKSAPLIIISSNNFKT